MITFSCPRCGTRYDVDDRLGGRRGRCKRCGHIMQIPAPTLSAAVSGMFRLRPDAAPAPAAAVRAPAASRFPSDVGLAPLTVAAARPVAARPEIAAYLKESTSGDPYALVASRAVLPGIRAGGGRPAGFVTRAYRGQVGGLLTLLRRLNDFAYLVSIPFLVIVLVGIVLKSRPMALAGATGVVLLNVGRLVVDGFYLFARPFRDSPIHGILFLVPPYTVYYLATRWKAMRKAALRFIEPAATIGLVVLAFAFIPWLSSGTAGEDATVPERLRSEAGALKADMRGEIETRGAALGGLSEKAGRGVDALKRAADDRRDPTANPAPDRAETPR